MAVQQPEPSFSVIDLIIRGRMTVKKHIMTATALAMLVGSVPAYAQNSYDPNYRGSDTRYPCKKSSGTTGTVAGGVGGALVGHALGGGTLGTLAGAGGGALLGRHLDKKHDEAQNRKNGC